VRRLGPKIEHITRLAGALASLAFGTLLTVDGMWIVHFAVDPPVVGIGMVLLGFGLWLIRQGVRDMRRWFRPAP
jgi:hypothetical protein